MGGSGVCTAYAGSLNLLLGIAGVECVYVSGAATGRGCQKCAGGECSCSTSHEWNKVKLGGGWYNIDVCWDDPLPNRPNEASHKYFCVTDAAISADHDWNKSLYPLAADSEEYNYFVLGNLVSNDYDQFKEIVNRAVKAKDGPGDIMIELYVKNYEKSGYGMGFITETAPDVKKITCTNLAGSEGYLAILLSR
jgi:hypothetical protein